VAVGNVAMWNGSAWTALGTGVNGVVNAIAVSGTNVYVGGSFSTAGGLPASNLARWDSLSWSGLGGGVDGNVKTAVIYGTELVVAGAFTAAGGQSAARVARWNGSAWSSLGAGMNDEINALIVSGSTLYAGGAFTSAGGKTANRVARWNGASWAGVGDGVNGVVNALALCQADLYVGGLFTSAGGSPASNVAKWNGYLWSALGSGSDGPVYAMAVFGLHLYTGGGFSVMGGGATPYLARAVLPAFVTASATYTRTKGLSLRIPIESLTVDLNDNAVSVISMGPSAQGASITQSGGYFLYKPASGSDGTDTFTYTASNGLTSDVGTVTVMTAVAGGAAKTITISGGAATIKFFGIPGLQYDVQRTTSLSQPVTWTTLTVEALSPGADGSFSYVDSSLPDGIAYYRSIQR